MTFVRAQRYLQEAEKAATQEQFFSLCMQLGRIHTGIRKICVCNNVSGSCRAAYIESILLAAGYRVGRMTKQATDGLRSRIRLDGEMISHKLVCELTEQIMQGLDSMIASLKALIPLLDSANNVKTNISTNNKTIPFKSDEAVLEDFLKKIGF